MTYIYNKIIKLLQFFGGINGFLLSCDDGGGHWPCNLEGLGAVCGLGGGTTGLLGDGPGGILGFGTGLEIGLGGAVVGGSGLGADLATGRGCGLGDWSLS